MDITDRLALHRAASDAMDAATYARTPAAARAADALYRYCLRLLGIGGAA